MGQGTLTRLGKGNWLGSCVQMLEALVQVIDFDESPKWCR